jgi:hypothetical protein
MMYDYPISLKTERPSLMKCYFAKILSWLFAVAVTATAVCAQVKPRPKVTPAVPSCVLDKTSAPKVRGFFLGQALASIELPRLPAAYKDSLAIRSASTEIVVVSVHEIFPDMNGKDLAKFGFDGVNFTVHFFDEKVKAVHIAYQEYDPDTAAEFVESVSKTLNLPAEGWKYRGKYMASLKCANFTISVWTGLLEGRPGYRAFPMLSLNDDEADKADVQRIAERRRKAQEAEAELKRQEQIKRKTFKP